MGVGRGRASVSEILNDRGVSTWSQVGTYDDLNSNPPIKEGSLVGTTLATCARANQTSKVSRSFHEIVVQLR